MTVDDDDLERRLRAALHLRAAEVTPDPRTWQRVVERAERVRRRALVLVGGATAAVLLVVAAVALDVVRPRVAYPPGEAPDETQVAPAPAPDGGPCGGAALVLVVRTAGGALDGSCADGTVADLTAGAGPADDPALSADGALLAFQRQAGAAAEVAVRDLRTGAERVIGVGGQPAFAPDGRIARVAPSVDPDPTNTRIVVTTPTGDELDAFLAADGAGAGGAEVVDLAWTPDGTRLTYGLVSGELDRRTDVLADPATGSVDPLMAHEEARGGEHSGSWPLGPAQYVTLSRCCPALGGDDVGRVTLAVAGYRGQPGAGFAGPQHRALVDLTDLLGFAPDKPGPAYLVRPLGRARAEAAGAGLVWSSGPAEAFLVGDGAALWLIDADGDATFLRDGVTAAAVNPAAFGGGATDGGALLADRRAQRFARPDTVDVQVFFAAEGGGCTATRPVTRTVPLPRVAQGALGALLAGPTDQERAGGAASAFSAVTADLLGDMALQDGLLTVDLEALDGVLPRPASACEADALRAQLDATLLQFDGIREVRYLVEGEQDAWERHLTPRRTPAPADRPRTPVTPDTAGPADPPAPETTTVALDDEGD